jgi:hypothetical protein
MVDNVLARHKILQGWNYNFTSCGVLCARLDKYVCVL